MTESDRTRGEGPAHTRRAVALRYDESNEPVPRVLAKGSGDTARRILELARKHDVPVSDDPDLVELLTLCEVGEAIPVELYESVAELLAYLFALNEAAGSKS